jgi:hypothetical protein
MSLRSVGLSSDYKLLQPKRPVFIITAVRATNSAGVRTFDGLRT